MPHPGGRRQRGRPSIARSAVALTTLLLAGLLAVATAPPAHAVDGMALTTSPAGQVPVGGTLTVSGQYGNLGPDAVLFPYIETFVTDAFVIESASVGGNTAFCGVNNATHRVICAPGGLAVGPGGTVGFSVTLTATTIAYDQLIQSRASTEVSSTNAAIRVDVIDPSITSDVYLEIPTPSVGVVGEPLSLTGSAINAGATELDDVVATFAIPSELGVDAATWGVDNPCTVGTSLVTCAIGTIPPWTAVPIAVDITPTATGSAVHVGTSIATSGTEDDPDPHPDAFDIAFPVVTPVVDLGLEFGAFRAVVLDQETVVTFWVTNHGPAIAHDIVLSITVPANFEVSYAEPACTTALQVVTCSLGDRHGGTSAQQLDFGLIPRALVGDPLVASVASAEPEVSPDPTPNSISETVPVEPPTNDVSVELGALFEQPIVGDPFTFFYNVITDGPTFTVPDVVGTVDVPEGWNVLSATADWNGAVKPCTIDGQKATCTFGEIPGDVSRPYMRVIAVPTQAEAGVVVKASANTGLPDPHPENNTISSTLDVLDPVTDLRLFDGHQFAPAAGIPFDYFVNVENRGPAIAHDLVITVSVPDGVGDVSATINGDPCVIVGRAVTCELPVLAVDAFTQVGVTATPDGTVNDLTFLSAVASATPEMVPDPSPNAASLTVSLNAIPGAIVGLVTAPVNPVGTRVVAFRTTDQYIPTASTTVTPNSPYVLTGLPPGIYTLRFVPPTASGLAPQWLGGAATRAAATTLAVLGDGSTLPSGTETLQPSSTVTGTVTGPGGEPVPGVRVVAYRPTDAWVGTSETTTAADGSYRLAGLPPDSYKIRFVPTAASGLASEWFAGATKRAAGSSIVLTPGTLGLGFDASLLGVV